MLLPAPAALRSKVSCLRREWLCSKLVGVCGPPRCRGPRKVDVASLRCLAFSSYGHWFTDRGPADRRPKQMVGVMLAMEASVAIRPTGG